MNSMFGARLKQVRGLANVTQQGLAERSGLGLGSIRDIEQGLSNPTWTTVLTLARTLGVSVETFAQGTAPVPEIPSRGRPRRLNPPLKWHGGKAYLASRIVELMPTHTTYVEPFAGGLAVLLAKPPEGVNEVVNDLDQGLTNFWRIVREPATFTHFYRLAQSTPFSEKEWQDAGSHLDHPDPVQRALAFFIRCRQSLAGRRDTFAPLSVTRTRRGMNEQASAWLSAVDGLSAVHDRLRRVAVLNRPAVEVIRQHDGEGTLYYLDPPYLKSTRTAPDVYQHEMDESHHLELLDTLRGCKGKAILSGYPHPLYDEALPGWQVIDFDLPNHSAGGASKRRMTERLWLNYHP